MLRWTQVQPLITQLIKFNLLDYHKNEFEFSNEETSSLLGIDQFRGNELIFQPSIIGVDQAGLAETINSVLKLLSPEDQKKVTSCVFLTVLYL